MTLSIEIKKDGVIHSFGFLNGCDKSRVIFTDEFIIDFYKNHFHSYYFRAFFYKSKRIYVSLEYRTKRKLYSAVQELLKEELYDVIQFYE